MNTDLFTINGKIFKQNMNITEIYGKIKNQSNLLKSDLVIACIEKSVAIYVSEYPYWDQVPLNSMEFSLRYLTLLC